MSLFFTIILMFNLLLLLVTSLISLNSPMKLEKTSPYESGFEFMSNTYTPFSLQFFLICIVFIIFDMEIILLLPIPNLWEGSMVYYSAGFIFFTLLTIGFFYEWETNALNWKYDN